MAGGSEGVTWMRRMARAVQVAAIGFVAIVCASYIVSGVARSDWLGVAIGAAVACVLMAVGFAAWIAGGSDASPPEIDR